MFLWQIQALFFLVFLLKHSLAITLNPLTVSLDHGGRTCSSCDSNEEMSMQRRIANKTQFCPGLSFHSDTHSTSLRHNSYRNERNSGR